MFKGIILSVIASVTFGVLYFYTQLLKRSGQRTNLWLAHVGNLAFNAADVVVGGFAAY